MKFSLKLSYHKVYFSTTWCKRSLLYDQTIEDINIFSPAFLVELRGVAQITPLSPIIFDDPRNYQLGTYFYYYVRFLLCFAFHVNIGKDWYRVKWIAGKNCHDTAQLLWCFFLLVSSAVTHFHDDNTPTSLW